MWSAHWMNAAVMFHAACTRLNFVEILKGEMKQQLVDKP